MAGQQNAQPVLTELLPWLSAAPVSSKAAAYSTTSQSHTAGKEYI